MRDILIFSLFCVTLQKRVRKPDSSVARTLAADFSIVGQEHRVHAGGGEGVARLLGLPGMQPQGRSLNFLNVAELEPLQRLYRENSYC